MVVVAGVGEEREGPLPGQTQEAEQQVDDLQDGEGLDDGVEVGGEEVEEEFGPEEGGDGGEGLVEGGGEDEEAGPVVFYQFAHIFLVYSLVFLFREGADGRLGWWTSRIVVLSSRLEHGREID